LVLFGRAEELGTARIIEDLAAALDRAHRIELSSPGAETSVSPIDSTKWPPCR
jgi:hypothetical protein